MSGLELIQSSENETTLEKNLCNSTQPLPLSPAKHMGACSLPRTPYSHTSSGSPYGSQPVLTCISHSPLPVRSKAGVQETESFQK